MCTYRDLFSPTPVLSDLFSIAFSYEIIVISQLAERFVMLFSSLRLPNFVYFNCAFYCLNKCLADCTNRSFAPLTISVYIYCLLN